MVSGCPLGQDISDHLDKSGLALERDRVVPARAEGEGCVDLRIETWNMSKAVEINRSRSLGWSPHAPVCAVLNARPHHVVGTIYLIDGRRQIG